MRAVCARVRASIFTKAAKIDPSKDNLHVSHTSLLILYSYSDINAQMEFVPNDSSLFRSSIEGLKEFLPNALIRIDTDGIRINGMDQSHVGFVDYFLSASDCAVLTVKTPTIIGVQTAVLSRALASVGSGDRVTLGLNKGGDKLVLSYANEKIGKRAVYEVPTIDIREDALDIPSLVYGASINAKTVDIAGAIKEAAHFGDTIMLRLDEDGFHISASGDAGTVRQTLENTDDREMSMNEDFVEVSFASKYVLSILKSGSPLSSYTLLDFDASQPLRATYKFGDASHFIAYLAPKITEDASV